MTLIPTYLSIHLPSYRRIQGIQGDCYGANPLGSGSFWTRWLLIEIYILLQEKNINKLCYSVKNVMGIMGGLRLIMPARVFGLLD